MGMLDLFGAAGAAGSIYGALDAADDVADLGNKVQTDLNTMGTAANTGSQFQGYGVTSTLGNTGVGADGSVNMNVGPNGAMQNQATNYMNAGNQMMQNSMQPTAGREQDIYNRTMAMQNPGLNAAQAQQQAREYAMGRGGVMGSQFGGTAEDAAMAKARAQAGNQAAFGAMQQAQAEQLQQANIANGFNQAGLANYEGSFMPMQQQMALHQLAGADADRSQTGQLTGQGYLTQLGLGGAQTNVNAQNVAAQLKGNLYDSILDNLGGSSTSEGGMSGIVGMLEGIFK